jgi:hypothetical protein
MFIKIDKYIPSCDAVTVYSYQVCDANGKVLSKSTSDFLNKVYKESKEDAQILVSQLIDMTKYGLLGRKEASTGREGLYALPEKHEEVRGKITSRYRLYFWVLKGSIVLVGGGCLKPENDVNGELITSYQEVQECEDAADELCVIGNYIEELEKKGDAFIEDGLIELDEEILKI